MRYLLKTILAPFVFAVFFATPVIALESLTDLMGSANVTLVRDGFGFTEGPAWDGKETLYFTDINNETIHALTGKELREFVKGSKHANGLMVDGEGKVIACQMDGALVAYRADNAELTVLADKFEDKRFNAPNDLAIDDAGGVYFTDPHYRAPDPLPQGTRNVYYRGADGTVVQVAKDLEAPNGIGLSLDQKTLYVVPSLSAKIYAYSIDSAGKTSGQKVFCTLKQPENQPESRPSGGDGMTIDEKGNLYITSALGVQVFSPAGEFIGTIKIPQQPANVAFGGTEGKTLFVTARTGLYQVEMQVRGVPTKGVVPLKKP